MEQAIEREQAAETIRAVEGLRRRTLTAVNRLSPVPPLMFGLAMLIATPFTWLATDRYESVREIIDGSVVEYGGSVERTSIPAIIAVGIATIAAVALAERHYRRQPVHPATLKRRSMSTVEAILLAAVLIVLGPFLVGSLFSIVLIPLWTGSAAVPVFVALTVASLVMGKRLKNGALAFAGALGLVVTGFSPLIYANHWETIASGSYAAMYLLAALLVLRLKSRAV
jgi:hypothetical protein